MIFDNDLTNTLRKGLDLLVFPENCYIPDGDILYNTDIFTENSEVRNFALQMSAKLGCGKQNVDMIINSSGGNVVYEKRYRCNRVRALENHCFLFCTIGYGKYNKPNSYTFGLII